jgi:hypothetical protein
LIGGKQMTAYLSFDDPLLGIGHGWDIPPIVVEFPTLDDAYAYVVQHSRRLYKFVVGEEKSADVLQMSDDDAVRAYFKASGGYWTIVSRIGKYDANAFQAAEPQVYDNPNGGGFVRFTDAQLFGCTPTPEDQDAQRGEHQSEAPNDEVDAAELRARVERTLAHLCGDLAQNPSDLPTG